jgi:inner membrane protein
MASIFAHGLVAYTLANVLDKKSIRVLILLAIFSSIIPDADVIAFKFGIPYEHPMGHRGFSHSILFAVIWSGILSLWFGKKDKLIYFLVLFFSTVSHGILDAMTTGGKGVGFFIPFDNLRYFLPWRPIKVSPIGIKEFFSEWGLQIIITELKYIAVPCVIVLITLALLKKRK